MTGVNLQTDNPNGFVSSPGVKGNDASTGEDVPDEYVHENVNDEDEEEEEDEDEEDEDEGERQIFEDEDDEQEEEEYDDDEEDGDSDGMEDETGGGNRGNNLTKLLLGDPNAEGEEEDDEFSDNTAVFQPPVAPEPISRKRSQQEVVDDEERDAKKVKA